MPNRLGEGRDLPGGQIAGQNRKRAPRHGITAQPGHQPATPARPCQYRRRQPPPRARPAAHDQTTSDRMNDFAGSLVEDPPVWRTLRCGGPSGVEAFHRHHRGLVVCSPGRGSPGSHGPSGGGGEGSRRPASTRAGWIIPRDWMQATSALTSALLIVYGALSVLAAPSFSRAFCTLPEEWTARRCAGTPTPGTSGSSPGGPSSP